MSEGPCSLVRPSTIKVVAGRSRTKWAPTPVGLELREVEPVSVSLAPEPVPLWQDGDGVIRVGRTRVTVDSVVDAFNDGATAEEIAQQYPSLELADVYAVIGFYLRHRTAVDVYRSDRLSLAEETRHLNEARFDPSGIRSRLLARKAGGSSG